MEELAKNVTPVRDAVATYCGKYHIAPTFAICDVYQRPSAAPMGWQNSPEVGGQGMSDDFKREVREIGRRLKVRSDTKRSEQQDQLSRVEDAIKHWERGIASDITQSVQDANTALAEAQAGVSLDCVEGTAGPVDSGERVGPSIPRTRPKITITIIKAGSGRGRTTDKQLEISITQDGGIAVLPFHSSFTGAEFDKHEIQKLILAFVQELEDEGFT